MVTVKLEKLAEPMARPPRDERTPESEAEYILSCLADVVIRMSAPGKEEHNINELAERMAIVAKGELDCEEAYTAFRELGPELKSPFFFETWFDVVVSLCFGAMDAHADGNDPRGWSYVQDAWTLVVCLSCSVGGDSDGKPSFSELARIGANARHAPLHELRRRAAEMYRGGNFKSKDNAAESIAPELGVAFRTARDWLKGV
jgi:hypothetical protein